MSIRPRGTLSEWYASVVETIRGHISAIPDDDIRAATPETLAADLVEMYGLPHLKGVDWSVRKERLGVRVGAVVQVVLEPAPKLADALSHKPATLLMTPEPEMTLEEHILYARCPTDGVTNTKRRIEESLLERTTEIKRHNEHLTGVVEKEITRRQKQVEDEDKQLARVATEAGIRITRRSDPRAAPLDLTTKRHIEVVRTPSVGGAPRSRLTATERDLVLTEVVRICRQFEVAPETFSKQEEDDLRNIVVGLLDAVFAIGGVASGETFRKEGKTDILLRVSSGAVFVAECKWWDGAAKYGEALDQLFRYVTHRDTEAALVTFVRNADFSGTVHAASDATSRHATVAAGPTTPADGRFESEHNLPGDSKVRVTVQHMLFHIPGRTRRG